MISNYLPSLCTIAAAIGLSSYLGHDELWNFGNQLISQVVTPNNRLSVAVPEIHPYKPRGKRSDRDGMKSGGRSWLHRPLLLAQRRQYLKYCRGCTLTHQYGLDYHEYDPHGYHHHRCCRANVPPLNNGQLKRAYLARGHNMCDRHRGVVVRRIGGDPMAGKNLHRRWHGRYFVLDEQGKVRCSLNCVASKKKPPKEATSGRRK